MYNITGHNMSLTMNQFYSQFQNSDGATQSFTNNALRKPPDPVTDLVTVIVHPLGKFMSMFLYRFVYKPTFLELIR